MWRKSSDGILQPSSSLTEYNHRALLPDLVKFAYVSADEHRIHEQQGSSTSKRRAESPDLYAPVPNDGDEHVLVMEFAETPSGSFSTQKK